MGVRQNLNRGYIRVGLCVGVGVCGQRSVFGCNNCVDKQYSSSGTEKRERESERSREGLESKQTSCM